MKRVLAAPAVLALGAALIVAAPASAAGPGGSTRGAIARSAAGKTITAVARAARAVSSRVGAPSVSEIELLGHGDGPGIGMGQWGAFGDAVHYHLGYEQILDQYYGRTNATTLSALGRAADPLVRVVVLENMDLATNRGFDPVITSASAFTIVEGTATGAAPSGTTPASSTTTSTATTSTRPTSSTPATTVSSTTPPATSTTSAVPPTTEVPTTTSAVPPASTIPPTTSTVAPTSTTGGNLLSASPQGGRVGVREEAALVTCSAAVVPAGEAVDLRLEKNGTWSAFAGPSCSTARRAVGGAPIVSGLTNPVVVPASSAPAAPATKLLTLCRHDGVDETLRGRIEAYDRDGFERTINLTSLDAYLDGVVPGEESSSWGLDGGSQGAPQGEAWGFQALEAQAVAARSYALAEAAAGGWDGYADICDTDECQSYVGVDYESSLTDQAVADSTGQVRIAAGSTFIASTRYSASTGGYTAPSAFPAVPDPGDTCMVPGSNLECNPDHSWSVSVPASLLERRVAGIGPVTGVRVVARDHRGSLGGRAVTVVVTGRLGERELTASAFAAALGLHSDWFAVSRLIR